MTMKPFLQEIAEYYIKNRADKLEDYCFVFPNKRSSVFFSHFLAEAALADDIAVLHPEVMTISDLVAEQTDAVEATRLEQLFILYHCYRSIIKEDIAEGAAEPLVDFNKFRYWGDVLLNDFTDVDKYMVDPAEIFHNIETLKEISADYLTPEQVKVIERYWGMEKIPPRIKDFWRHVVHTSKSNDHVSRIATTSFLKLWQVMFRLYTAFRAELVTRGLSYQGMIYRDALARLKDTPAQDLPYERYVFIGFNVLSTVEHGIFATLHDKRRADFFWDFVSPAFADVDNRATRFLRKYVKEFPQPLDAHNVGAQIKTFPDIEVISVPSVEGQIKLTSQIVGTLFPENQFTDSQLLSTAIVLPDETLALPVIDSLPSYIDEVNVTMGYQLRNTPAAALIGSVISMQLRARKLHNQLTYFHEDVRAVLAHPLVRSINSLIADRIVTWLNTAHVFNIPVTVFDTPDFAPLRPLFASAGEKDDAEQVFAYLENLCRWLLSNVIRVYSLPQSRMKTVEDDDYDVGTTLKMSSAGAIEAGFLRQYLVALDELQQLRKQHIADLDVDLTEGTIFHLVERLVGGESVRFEGMPLRGLQIMGVLETRVLDFDNVVILSMNENIFPRKHFSKSFIPPALRAGYGMSTIDHQESISAYYFYRLISRAKNVKLLYDSRTVGLSSGEPSRYINQLRYIYSPENLKLTSVSYHLVTRNSDSLTITLQPHHIERLRQYMNPDSGKALSASAINRFINCPVEFVLQNLEGYGEDDELLPFMDEKTYGSVLHQVVERLYKSQQRNGQPLLVDEKLIKILDNDILIKREIVAAINELYLRIGKDNQSPLVGDSEMIARLMLPQVRNMLRHELDIIPEFYFIGAEVKSNLPKGYDTLRFPRGLSFNFKYFIDRVDKIQSGDTSITRIIDYKTGSDVIEATDVASMFNNQLKNRPKAMLQLFLYANAYAQFTPGMSSSDPILPQIYSFKTIAAGSAPQKLRIAKQEVTDYREWNDEFLDYMESELTKLFKAVDNEDGSPITFRGADNDYACNYCMFKTICGKN